MLIKTESDVKHLPNVSSLYFTWSSLNQPNFFYFLE